MKRLAVYVVFVLASLIYLPASAQVIGIGTPPLPINQGSLIPSNPIPPITTLDTAGLGLLTGVIHAVATPVDMKLLILATDGTEPGLAALQFFLDYLGTPYQVVLLANGQPLPPLDNGIKGLSLRSGIWRFAIRRVTACLTQAAGQPWIAIPGTITFAWPAISPFPKPVTAWLSFRERGPPIRLRAWRT